MTITLKLYGELRERVNEASIEKGFPATVDIEIGNLRKVRDVLFKLEIDEMEISHIFVNGIYTGSGMYIKDGDRIGIFPTKMALMFAEIPDINSIYISINFKEGNLYTHLKIPEGSTLKSILKKLRLPKDIPDHKILVNGIQLVDDNSVIYAKDRIEILSL
ncbi:MAG: MoaD/ThiS family protein [Candidatus Lokiarchaeota archaeon]|nr:MoaD/ThiS family protein [Candidatus Lokiarchaeota archaeon]